MFKKCILVIVTLVMLMFIFLFFLSLHQTKNVLREPSVLMNKYYRLKQTNPEAAQRALRILLSQHATYQPAINEAKRLSAGPIGIYTSTSSPLPQEEEVDAKRRVSVFSGQSAPSDDTLIRPVGQLLPEGEGSKYLCRYQGTCSRDPEVLHHAQPPAFKQPTISQALTKAGFLAIKQNRPYEAIDDLSKAFALTNEPLLAMQLGYLYDQIGDKPAAYKFFKLATHSKDQELKFRAENAMTNLAGLQIKALPFPYFSEVFFNPFSQSRFGLTVRPFVARLGVEQDNAFKTKQYVIFRRTDDNKSKNLGQISQIYEDNVQITGMGGQVTPIQGFPLVGFLEAGAAYDLVYRDRPRWRSDLRTGLMYYNEFCARPAYVDKVTLSKKYYSDLYAEATYFTRYSNVISGVKTHQGIRLLQYHSSMVNLYATGRIIADTQRLFFNNFVEIGPGIEYVPTNRLNIKILFEHVNGVYLPAGKTPNPYNQYYTNNLVQLLFYVKV